ncbi:MAG TPA: GGDEF domain-containing protein [Candidatus Marinimicrobia bacterium]|nr:GGDEF domain-containing protein [Candidatus Neomarinimicrobiota bacterium]
MKKPVFLVTFFIWILGFFIWVLPVFETSVILKTAGVMLWFLLGIDLFLIFRLDNGNSDNNTADPEHSVLTSYLTALNSSQKEDEIFKALKQVLSSRFKYDKLVVCRRNPQDLSVLKVIFSDGPGEYPCKGDSLPGRKGLWAYVLGQKDAVLLSHYRNNAPFEYRLTEGDMSHTPYQSLMAWGVNLDEFKSGVISLESTNPEEYSEKDLELFNLISLNFASSYLRVSTLDTYKKYATVDGLTGVLNHRAFKEKLFEEVYRARRYDHPLTLLMLDLDNFKKINDNHGHLYGDYMLRIVADIIKNNIRMVDIVARYGGEEFTVILANADKDMVLGTANRIRQKISEYPFEQDGVKSSMTVSIGMASFPVDSHDGLSLIQAADDAMYKAKKSGKNRVETYKSNGGT